MTKSVHISPDLSFPLDVVTQTIGVLAKRRAGKSYFLRRLVEQLFKARQQVVIADPKGDWWGIRSSANGKTPGLPIVIFGGERGDVALEAGAGELVAKLVVEERVSALLDLSLLRKHEVATFMSGFLENLYRLKAREQYRTAMMLAIDEADAIAPQKAFGGEERMLGAAEDIVRRGGQRGIGCAMATQRAAVLNKNVLTQIQILVTLRTIAPQDLKAVKEWVNVHGTEEEWNTLMDSLPALPVGDAWVWSPGWPTTKGIFERVHVLPIETFDSGATPKPGEKRVEPKQLADIDLDAVRKQMASTLERQKENDPKAIRKKYEARVAELERELKVRPKPAAEAKRVEVPVLKAEHLKRIEQAVTKIEQAVVAGVKVHNGMLDQVNRSLEMWGEIKQVTMALAGALQAVQRGPASQAPPPPPTKNLYAVKPAPPAAPPRAVRTTDSNENADAMIVGKGALCRILVALAQHPEGLNYRKIGVFSGVSTKGGSFSTYLSRARKPGWIVGDDKSGVRITREGLAALGDFEPLPQGRALLEYWTVEVGDGALGSILNVIAAAYPEALTYEEIHERSGRSIKGGSFSTYLSRLRSRDIIESSGKRQVRLVEELAG